MKTLINIYDPSSNFWDLNPNFKTQSPYCELFKKDRKRTKLDSSRDMWVIAGLYDRQSNYSEIEEDPNNKYGQYKTVSRDICGDEKWLYENEARLQPYMEKYGEDVLTKASKALKRWEKKLQARDKVLDETEYEIGITDQNGKLVGSNVAILDKMFVDTGKIWDVYFKIQAQLEAELEDGGSVKGEGEESLSDTGEI